MIAKVAQTKNCPFGVSTSIGVKNIKVHPTIMHLAGYVSTKKYAGIVEDSYSFQFNLTINSKRQFLDFATVAFS